MPIIRSSRLYLCHCRVSCVMPWLLVVGCYKQSSKLCVRDEGGCASRRTSMCSRLPNIKIPLRISWRLNFAHCLFSEHNTTKKDTLSAESATMQLSVPLLYQEGNKSSIRRTVIYSEYHRVRSVLIPTRQCECTVLRQNPSGLQ